MPNKKETGTIEEIRYREGKKGCIVKVSGQDYFYFKEFPEGVGKGSPVKIEYSEKEFNGKLVRTLWNVEGAGDSITPPLQTGTTPSAQRTQPFNEYKEQQMVQMAALKNATEFWKAYLENERALGRPKEFNLDSILATANLFREYIKNGKPVVTEESIPEEKID